MPTIYTITIPDDGGEGTLLVKKGDLAHLMRLPSTSRDDIAFAMLAAQTEIEALEANPPQVSEAPPEKTKSSKPKKKRKVSLDDIPEDDETPMSQPEPIALAVGQRVQITTDATDVDGEPLEFDEGNICEIDDATAWVESLDGEYDVWVNVAHLTPITGKSRTLNKSTSQMTLFG